MQIFFFHFAGGSCYSYDFMKDFFPKHFSLHFLELPGRGKRFREDFVLTKKAAIDDFVNQLKCKRRKGQDYIIYGHSMGAYLGLIVSKRMEELGDPPKSLFVSGNPGPEVKASGKQEKRHLMDDKRLKEELLKLGGVEKELVENDELFLFFSPILRADFQIMEDDGFPDEQIKIAVPIYAFMGNREEEASKIENWSNYTISNFEYRYFEGDHFFIRTCREELSLTILSYLE